VAAAPFRVGAEPSGAEIQTEIEALFARSSPAIIRIEAVDPMGRLSGTGFFIDPDGTLLTAYSIGGETSDIEVTFNGRRLPAERVFADRRSGVAMLKVESNSPFLSVGSSDALKIAAPVMLIGFPMDLPLSPALGVVAGRDVKYGGRCFSTAHLRVNLPIQRGQGGAPLLDLEGHVVGIVISSLDHSAGCFALPIEAAEKVRRDFIRFGAARPGWLGVTVGEAADPVEGSRARVDGFIESSPALDSGLKEGDILVGIGNRPIASPEDVLSAAFYLTVGDPVELTVKRGGETLSIPVIATRHPQLGVATAAAERASPSNPGGCGVLLMRWN
jgi:serine protease Do